MDNLQHHFKSIKLFNEIAGQLEVASISSVDNQLGFIFSELTETIDAMENRDAVELVDGFADLLVTVLGGIQKLEKFDIDFDAVMERVCENNLSKFPHSVIPISETQPDNSDVTLNTYHELYVYTDHVTGKVKKPKNFKSVFLRDLVKNKIKFD